jgi:hypothetical protein
MNPLSEELPPPPESKLRNAPPPRSLGRSSNANGNYAQEC